MKWLIWDEKGGWKGNKCECVWDACIPHCCCCCCCRFCWCVCGLCCGFSKPKMKNDYRTVPTAFLYERNLILLCFENFIICERARMWACVCADFHSARVVHLQHLDVLQIYYKHMLISYVYVNKHEHNFKNSEKKKLAFFCCSKLNRQNRNTRIILFSLLACLCFINNGIPPLGNEIFDGAGIQQDTTNWF